MGLLRFFATNEMTIEIQKMADKPYQKAFIVAHVASLQNPASIDNLISDFEKSDYAFVGDIYQVRLQTFSTHLIFPDSL